MTAPNAQAEGSRREGWHLFVPKTYTVLRQGYGFRDFRSDAVAGLTVAIIALPLAMALAIASGTGPERGLYTAIVAGFLISAFGGSRFQIGGPTGAFVVVVFNVIAGHGYDGLVMATLMAGMILLMAGLLRLGTYIKYVPQPVVTGFTAGIAVIIFSSQITALLGLALEAVPADFVDKWSAYAGAIRTADLATMMVAGASLAVILLIRRYRPNLPVFLLAVIGGAVLVAGLGLPVATIGSQFGGIPASLPAPVLPAIDLARLPELLPSALTIAFLAGIESLLSAVVADSMTGRRHRSNCELVAQGLANIGSVCFGGIPATGAIARTATNIRAGGRSPVAGMLHSVFLLLFMLVAAPLASFVPLASLGAVLVVVAWNMSEHERFRRLLSAPPGDVLVLLLTFGLTVFVDLTVALEVGVVLGAVIFMHRMAKAVEIERNVTLIEPDVDDLAERTGARRRYEPGEGLPDGVELLHINGPFFFGVAAHLTEVLDQIRQPPQAVILDLSGVPLIDASGVHALTDLVDRARRDGMRVVLSGLQPQPAGVLERMGLAERPDGIRFAASIEAALAMLDKPAPPRAPPPPKTP